MKFDIKYFIAFIMLFLTEVFIALYVHDTIVRPFIGDILVIILIYCFIKSFLKAEAKLLPLFIFAFAVIVEILQYFNIVHLLGLQDHTIIKIIIGSVFDIKDVLCYFIGMVILFIYQYKKACKICTHP